MPAAGVVGTSTRWKEVTLCPSAGLVPAHTFNCVSLPPLRRPRRLSPLLPSDTGTSVARRVRKAVSPAGLARPPNDLIYEAA
jgi:hypothetical protein